MQYCRKNPSIIVTKVTNALKKSNFVFHVTRRNQVPSTMYFDNHDFDPVLNKFSNWCQNLQARELTQNMQTCGQGVDVLWKQKVLSIRVSDSGGVYPDPDSSLERKPDPAFEKKHWIRIRFLPNFYLIKFTFYFLLSTTLST